MYYWYEDNPNCGRCGNLNGQGFCSLTACAYPIICESSTLVVNPITNYDRIISKTPEELAKHYSKLVGCQKNAVAYRGCAAAPECNASACWLDWLRQEAAE